MSTENTMGSECNTLSRETRNDDSLLKILQRRVEWLEAENQQLRLALAHVQLEDNQSDDRTNQSTCSRP